MEELVAHYRARHYYSYVVRLIAKESATAFKGVLVADLDRERIEAHFGGRFASHQRGTRCRHESVLHAMLTLALRERSLYLIPYWNRSEEHTSELQSLMRISYAVFCLKKKNTTHDTS